MRPTVDATGGDLAPMWLLPAEERVDEPPANMVATAGALMLGRLTREEEKRMFDMSVSLLAK